MTEHDYEPENATSETASTPSAWRKPLLLAAIGLVLMLGGYKAMDYVPSPTRTPRQAEQERLHSDLRKRATQQSEQGGLAERLDQIAPPWREPPFRVPGRLALYFGFFLFLAAGVLMYRQAPEKSHHESHE